MMMMMMMMTMTTTTFCVSRVEQKGSSMVCMAPGGFDIHLPISFEDALPTSSEAFCECIKSSQVHMH